MNQENPCLLTCLQDVNFITAGEECSLAICKQAGCFTWGRNDYGQLGHGNTQDILIPLKIQAFHNCQISHAAFGQTFAVYVIQNFKIFVSGSNNAMNY